MTMHYYCGNHDFAGWKYKRNERERGTERERENEKDDTMKCI